MVVPAQKACYNDDRTQDPSNKATPRVTNKKRNQNKNYYWNTWFGDRRIILFWEWINLSAS